METMRHFRQASIPGPAPAVLLLRLEGEIARWRRGDGGRDRGQADGWHSKSCPVFGAPSRGTAPSERKSDGEGERGVGLALAKTRERSARSVMKQLILFLATTAVSFCGTLHYQVTVDTTGLGSGFLDLQFNPGSPGGQAATATVTNFVPWGGVSGVPATSGSVTGTLAGGNLVLTNTAGMDPNRYHQAIDFGNSLSLLVTFAGPLLDNPAGTGIDTAFEISLLSASGAFLLANRPIVRIDLFSDGTASSIVFVDGGSADPTEPGIPEPKTFGLFATGLALLAWRRRS